MPYDVQHQPLGFKAPPRELIFYLLLVLAAELAREPSHLSRPDIEHLSNMKLRSPTKPLKQLARPTGLEPVLPP